MFEVRCQACESTFEVDERRVPRGGMQMRCQKCNASFLVKRPLNALMPGADPASLAKNLSPTATLRDDPGLPMALDAASLPVPVDPEAALPMPKDLNFDLPSTFDGGALPAAMSQDFTFDLSGPAPTHDDQPGAMDFGLDLMTKVEATDLPSVLDFSPAQEPMGGIPASRRVPPPTPTQASKAMPAPVSPPESKKQDEIRFPVLTGDLPALAGIGLPMPGGVAGLPATSGAGLPAISGAGLPAVGATGLPAVGAAGLPAVSDVWLPTPASNLPATVDLPATTEALPAPAPAPGILNVFGVPMPEADPLPPIVTSPTMGREGARLGRIGLERKAFTISGDDLPTPAGGAALPTVSRGARPARRPPTPAPAQTARPVQRKSPVPEVAASLVEEFDVPVRGEFDAPVRGEFDAPVRGEFDAPPEFPLLDLDDPVAPPPSMGGGFGEIDLGSIEPVSVPPSFGFSHPSNGPMALAEPSLPPLDNPFDAALQSDFPPAASMAPAPLADEILDSLKPPMDSLAPPLDYGAGNLSGTLGFPEEFEPAAKPEATEKSRFGGRKKEAEPVSAPTKPGRFKAVWVLYGTLGLLAVGIVGGAALALTPYGAFGKNWIDEQLHGDDRLAAAERVIQQVERTLERDTYESALNGLRRLDQALARVPQVKELQAYIVYANNIVAARFGPEPSRIGRARQVLAQLREAPPGMRYLNLARASESLVAGNAREALRVARSDPGGRDLATLAAERVGDVEQWLRLAQQGRQRHPSARSRYLLARAAQARGDHETARREAEEVLRVEGGHGGARILLARLLSRFEPERDRALELLRDLVRDNARPAAPTNGRPAANGRPPAARTATPLGASVAERAEACVVAGQIELVRDRVSTAQSRFQHALELDPRSASALVGIGSILYRQGAFSDAQARFRNAYSADRNNLDAVIGIAQSSLALNRASDAKEVIEPAVREHPNDGRLHYWLGKALAATTDQRTLAQQALREAIRLQPENLDAYVSLSELLLAMQRPDAADQVLLEARARVPESAAIHRALAHGRLARGDLAGSEAELRLAIQREPDDIRSHFALGDVLRRMQRLDDAQAEFDIVGRADPNYPGLAMTRGLLAEARGELPQALSTFREALARDPTNAELINRVAATLVALGNYGDADQMLRSVVVDQPTNAEAQYIMGRARLGADNFVDAVHYLDRAIELNPQRADYKAYGAEAHRRSGDILRALQLAEQSIELDAAFPRGYWVRAGIRLHRGEAANALADINRATQLDPRFWAAYATWADIDDALGRRQESIRLYRFAIEHENRHGDWFYNLGRLLADAGDQGEARGAFSQARALGSGLNPAPTWYAQATRALADIERERNNRGDAQRLYTEYLRLVPQGSPSYNSAALVLSDMLSD